MPEQERSGGVRGQGLNRCPFCHDGIEVDQDGWVACGRCLSRHHPGCWSEGSGCASCGHTNSLTLAPGEPAPPPKTLSQLQAEAYAAFEPASATALPHELLDLLTLGSATALGAEQRYLEHKRQNRAQEPPFADVERVDIKLKLYRVHERALNATPSDTYRRWFVGLSVLFALALPVVGCAWLLGAMNFHDGRLAAGVLAGIYPLLLTTHAHLFRESLIRHERGQLVARLVARGSSREVIDGLRESTARGWTTRRWQQSVLSLLALIPGVNAFMIFAAPFCVRQSELQHALHEALLDEACPPAPLTPPPTPGQDPKSDA